jgi:hypothetical protein
MLRKPHLSVMKNKIKRDFNKERREWREEKEEREKR